MKQRSHAVLFGTKNKLRKASLIFASIDENKTKPLKKLTSKYIGLGKLSKIFLF